MADISLRDYLAKLESLFDSGDANQVIHHCRQILQYYPKNVEAYRVLGRALLDTQSYAEAGEVFRRVLSVFPDDLTAHIGLSNVALQEKRPEDAIWHLERAYEQDPNSPDIIEHLRELYRKHRRIELSRLQLTTGAVVRQYMRNGLFEQAIDTVQQALERSPERVDLQVLLAQTYWECGRKIEAGETALEIVKTIPDCLEANRILTQLWLSEQRPTDAQRYINRIQSVDPYLALELAQGTAIPSDTFRLEELDYRRAAERVITQTPDWLRNMETPAEGGLTDDDWMRSMSEPSSASSAASMPDASLASSLPDDWLTSTASETDEHEEQPAQRSTSGLTGLLAALDLPDENEEPAVSSQNRLASDDLFGDMEDVSPPSDSLILPQSSELPPMDDLFAGFEDAAPAAGAEEVSGPETDYDPLAWLRESGIEVDERARRESAGFVDDEDEDLAPARPVDNNDPLAWMQGYGSDLIDADSAPAAADDLPVPESDEEDVDDPLAWLNESAPAGAPRIEAAETSVKSTSEWLADESLLDEALSLEALLEDQPADTVPPVSTESVTATAQMPDGQDAMSNDAFNWLNEPDSQPESDQPGSDWMAENASSENPAEEELPGALLFDASPSDESAEESPAADWISEMGMGGDDEESTQSVPDWLAQAASEPDSRPAAPPADDLGFQWLETDGVSSSTPATAETEFGDIVGEEFASSTGSPSRDDLTMIEGVGPKIASALTAAGLGSFAALAEASQEQMRSALEAAGLRYVPSIGTWNEQAALAAQGDWVGLKALKDELVGGVRLSASPSVELDDVDANDETPDWLMSAAPVESASAPADDGFQWLDSSAAVQEEAPAEAGWLGELEPLSEEEEPAAAAETPDWLMSAAPVESAAAPADDGFQWLDSSAAVQEEAPAEAGWLGELEPLSEEEEPAAAAETPDWLMSAAPVESAAAPADDGFQWLDSSAAVQEEAPAEAGWLGELEPMSEEEEPAAAETPDWLMSAAPVESAAAPADDGFQWLDSSAAVQEEAPAEAGWLGELEPMSEEEEPAAAETPDWLMSAAPVESASATADDGFQWLDSSAAVQEEAPAEAGWLGELEPMSEEEEPAAAAETPDWLMSAAPVESAAAPADDGFQWLGSSAAVQEEAPAEAGWLGELEPLSEEEEPAAAAETPDWLMSAAPVESAAAPADDGFQWLDSSAAVQEEAPAEAGWLGELEPLSEEEEPAAAAETPDWLMSAAPVESASATADDGFQWLDSVPAEDSLELDVENTPEESTPDWLSNPPPIEFEDGGSAKVEEPEQFAWLDSQQNPQIADQVDQGLPIRANDWTPSSDLIEEEPVQWQEAELPEEAEPASEQGVPDWLAAVAPENTATEDVPAESEAMPDWLMSAAPEPAAANTEWEEEPAESEQPAAQEPEWLSAVKSSPTTLDASEFQWDEPASTGEAVPDWLTTLEAQPDSDSEISAAEQEAMSDWLSESRSLSAGPTAADLSEWMHRVTPDAEATLGAEQGVIDDDTPDWLDEHGDAETDETGLTEDDHREWLDKISTGTTPVVANADAEPVSSEFSWLDDMNPAAQTESAVPEPRLVPVEDMEADFGEVSTSLDDLAVVDESEVVAPVAADNAPDWLNAMVPGLDVDYGAAEDQPIESEFLPGSENRINLELHETARPREERDFAWLEAIVEEETQQVKAVNLDEPPVPRSKRFSFSRVPAWLRRPTEKPQSPAQSAADDIDLPPWLQ